MASNQASKVSVEPFLHSSFPSRKTRQAVVRLDQVGRVSYGAAQGIGVVVTTLCEHAPGHACEFCGQGNDQYIRVEPLGRFFLREEFMSEVMPVER
jgi:hypothetical protein